MDASEATCTVRGPHTLADLCDLWADFRQPLFGYLCVFLDDPNDAEDCLQDTFLRAQEHLAKGRAVNTGWLYKVGRNRALDMLRARGRRRAVAEASRRGLKENEGRADEAAFLVAQLSPSDREILYLFDVDGLEGKAIAELLGIRAGAVRTRIFRARERLRKLFTEWEGRER